MVKQCITTLPKIYLTMVIKKYLLLHLIALKKIMHESLS